MSNGQRSSRIIFGGFAVIAVGAALIVFAAVGRNEIYPLVNLGMAVEAAETSVAAKASASPETPLVPCPIPTFGSPVNYPAGVNSRKITRTFTVNGILDLAATNYASDHVSILRGVGDGTFLNPVQAIAGIDLAAATYGDLNADGRDDLVGVNFDQNNISAALNQGSVFSPPVFFPTGIGPVDLATIDFNNDGKVDIVSANQTSGNVGVLLGNGAGGFGNPSFFAVGNTPVSVAVSDFNLDGFPDIVTANQNANNVAVLRGTGTGGFGFATFNAVGNAPVSVAVGDVNADGRDDIVTANQGSGNVAVLRGNPTGGFLPANFFNVGFGPASVALGDVNLDGFPDIVTANAGANNISVLLNNGTGTFGIATNFPIGPSPSWIILGDFNRDGRPDLATSNFFSNNVSVLINTCPSAPTTLVVTNTNNTGAGSLRQAINDVAAGGTVTFSPLFNSPQTINLTSGELSINKNLTINGTGANLLTISGNNASRVFNINPSFIVNLSGMTMTGGNSGGGGAIINPATLTISNCVITSNTAGIGGGIYNGGTLTLSNSTVSNNMALIGTGGGTGGGIDNTGGTVTITNSTISGNSAPNGDFNGGGIRSNLTVNITSSTITNNSAAGSNSGGGIYRSNGSVTLRDSIIAANVNNASLPDVVSSGGGGILSNGFNLIGNRGTLIFGGPADQSGDGINLLNPLLGSLQNNGGPTQTHSLNFASPALDAGNSSGSATDQRGAGFLRVVDLSGIPNAAGGDGADIGAFEAQTAPVQAFATVSGSVMTPDNRALRNAIVSIIDSNNVRQIATTSSAGVYSLENVRTGEMYTMTVSSKRYRFTPIFVFVNGNMGNIVFVGLQ